MKAIIIVALFVLAGVLVLVYQFAPTDVVDVHLGEVATMSIAAPQQISYVSDIETETARERARSAVSTQFTPPDPRVARQQVTRLRKIFEYMETVRADPYASLADKFEWIDAIPDINVPDTVIDQILIMDETNWAAVKKESLRLLDTILRDEIKETQVLAKRRELPNKVALDIPQDQADVIVAITSDLIRANTFPDEAKTEAERQAAVDAVEPVVVTIEANEVVVPAGRVIGARELEKIEALGLQQPKFSWIRDFFAPATLVVVFTIVFCIYMVQYTPKLIKDAKRLILLALLVLVFLIIAKVLIPNGVVLPYMYPIAALTMMIAVLIDARLAFIIATIMAFLSGYIATERPEELVIYLLFSGWTGILALGRRPRINSILWAGMYVGLLNTIIITIFNADFESIFGNGSVGQLMLFGVLNGIFSSGLALIGLFAIGNLFGLTTSVQLMDLGRPTQPLLRQLLLKAPGTYHHSLMVSNLAEQAAERIGADSLLVRVMAYYHDIGKMQRPYFFIENQPEGMSNVHEKLDPQVSAQIIISHVTDGLDLARKYRLPGSLKNGIAQHHGTSLVRFFFYQAMEAAKEGGTEVDEAKFHYPGPKPQTRETGILMLADVSETTVRALKPRSAAEIDEIVQKAITHHLDTGQLDECDLTISDLHNIRRAFVDILQGIHHPRIKYPEQVKEEEQQAAQEAASSNGKEQAGAPTTETTPASDSLKSVPGSRVVRRE
ncbi:MAG: Cyclic-di-AMP phosphodiesterase PgpH [Anaerolineae bacterium]|nr:Cyclic-di-AMP phosphodiesterase PgpH [Anaerolineae bacterium]